MNQQLQEKIRPYSKAIVKLLKGTVEINDTIWEEVIIYRDNIQDYLNILGLELIIKEEDGYAFLKQFQIDEEGKTLGLLSRRKLPFTASVVLVILRQILDDFEKDPTAFQVTEKFISHSELKDEIEIFLPEQYNRVQFDKDLDSNIRKIADLGYLKVIKIDNGELTYKVHKIIKEKVTLNILKEFNEKLNGQ